MQTVGILGCGWLGKPLGKELVQSGFEVRASTTRATNKTQLGDLGLHPYVISFDPQLSGDDAAAFFASEIMIISIPPKRKSGKINEYLEQLENIQEAILAGHVRHVLFISSTSIYPDLNRSVSEADADLSSHMYKAEQIFLNNENYQTTVIRFAGLVGPERHPGKFLSGKEVAGGENPVNLIHQRDCIDIIKRIINDNKWGHVYNACAELHPSKKIFYTAAAKALDLPAPVFIEGQRDFKIVSTEKLKAELSYAYIYSDPMKMI